MMGSGDQAEVREALRIKLREALLRFGASLRAEELFPSSSDEAAFVISNPYAFAIATCLDRGIKADVVWTIPFEMRRALGRLDPRRLHSMSENELMQLLTRLPRKPRFMDAAPRTIKELTAVVVEEFQGDASGIWLSRSASQVKQTLLKVYGVGRGIANMAVLLIERAFGVRFSDLDRTTMDIKPDTHTCRVLQRLGVARDGSTDAAIEGARWLNPTYPGEVDGPLWIIGRRWCRPASPRCSDCPVQGLCKRIGISEEAI